MLEHAKYEELCALAATGQISAEEFAELQTHFQGCGTCEGLHRELLDIDSIWLTQAQRLEPEMRGQHSVLRTKILGTLQDAGAHFSEPIRKQIAAPPKKVGFFEVFRTPAPVWAMAALALVAGFLGFEVGTQEHFPQAESKSAALKSVEAPAPRPSDAGPRPKAQSNTPVAQNLPGSLEQRLAASESERTKALADLQSLRQDIAALQSSRDQDANQIAQLKAHSEQDQSAATSAQAQIRSLKEAEDAKNADLVATQIQLRDMEGKLTDQRVAAEREQALAEVSSSSEMRDVIASRNLHIIDVADVANTGVQRPFGRIFYTEGKSLIFYAYDLSGAKGAKTFYAWGHREGDATTTHALGSLRLDDAAQGRWVFKSNDAKVLAQIDSVYVTLEPTAKPGEKPKGQKILSAFLGTPANHP
jgi:hypothetical protein